MEIRGFEPLTPGLQSRCSSQLSYIPLTLSVKNPVSKKNEKRQGKKERKPVFIIQTEVKIPQKPVSALYTTHSLSFRKEVIQPHLPVRLPCYDFTPLTKRTFDSALLTVGLPASGAPCSDGVTGGVYKARERIHRTVLMCGY